MPKVQAGPVAPSPLWERAGVRVDEPSIFKGFNQAIKNGWKLFQNIGWE